MNMAEKKFWTADLMVDANVPDTWNFMSALGAIVQGTSASNRIGNKIFLHAIQYMITIGPGNPQNTVAHLRCRCILYHNKEAVGTYPTGAALFTPDSILGLRNQTLLNRYAVQRDVVHVMATGAYNATGNLNILGPQTQFRWTVTPKKRIDYSSNTGVNVADLYKDDYGIACIASTANICKMSVRVTVIFSDA